MQKNRQAAPVALAESISALVPNSVSAKARDLREGFGAAAAKRLG